MSIYINKIYNMNCLDLVNQIEDNSIDMIITSPPYDNLREYDSIDMDFIINIAPHLYRVLKDGGIMVWNVGDAVINGSETLTSFKQAIEFNNAGFNLHDTMIYEKNSSTFPARENGNRYTQIFEYMFVFSKGKPKTVNLICDKKNKWAGHSSFDGKIKDVPDYSPRTNIWKYVTSFDDKNEHPAIMPIQMAKDNIITWSNKGDIVLDIFMGSGTTAKASIELGRNFIGSEIDKKYFDIANKRISNVQTSMFAFL